jgi:hypothetical protein
MIHPAADFFARDALDKLLILSSGGDRSRRGRAIA